MIAFQFTSLHPNLNHNLHPTVKTLVLSPLRPVLSQSNLLSSPATSPLVSIHLHHPQGCAAYQNTHLILQTSPAVPNSYPYPVISFSSSGSVPLHVWCKLALHNQRSQDRLFCLVKKHLAQQLYTICFKKTPNSFLLPHVFLPARREIFQHLDSDSATEMMGTPEPESLWKEMALLKRRQCPSRADLHVKMHLRQLDKKTFWYMRWQDRCSVLHSCNKNKLQMIKLKLKKQCFCGESNVREQAECKITQRQNKIHSQGKKKGSNKNLVLS